MLAWTRPDGVNAASVAYSTTKDVRHFRGQTSATTLTVNGETITPLANGSFTYPDPALADGLEIPLGGSVTLIARTASEEASLTVYRVAVEVLDAPPTGVKVERYSDRVEIRVPAPQGDADLIGYNVYASAGGSSGWRQINLDTITTYTETVETTPFGSATYTLETADTLDLRVIGQVLDGSEVKATAFDDVIDLPYGWTTYQAQVQLSGVRKQRWYSFAHARGARPNDPKYPAVPYGEFQTLADSDPLLYCVTAVRWLNNGEQESAFSPALEGAPLSPTESQDLPAVSRTQILKDLTLSIYRTHPDVDVQPGTALRDLVLDPISLEAERVRFLINFNNLARSFAGLLSIDDPTRSGVSVPVASSSYKLALQQALFLRDAQSTQAVIDNAFEALAGERGLSRLAGVRSRGEATFYVPNKPTSSIEIPLGTAVTGGGVTFRTTAPGIITSASYSPRGRYWGVSVAIRAATPGAAGNLAANQITTVADVLRVSVTNVSPTYGGKGTESNLDLATRADRALGAVDSGTLAGTYQRVLSMPGVQEAQIYTPGDALHLAEDDRTVDVWIRGGLNKPQRETFAYAFQIEKYGEARPVGNVAAGAFRIVGLNELTPLQELLENDSWGWGFYASNSLGEVTRLNTADALIVPPDGFILSQGQNPNLAALVNQTDSFRVSYRKTDIIGHSLQYGPVESITSAARINPNGTLTDVTATLDAEEDPFGSPTDASVILADSTFLTQVTGEAHTLGSSVEYLAHFGVNPLSVRVYDPTRTTEYNSPYSGLTPDFTLSADRQALGIMPAGRLAIGDQVIVDYSHANNYVVDYLTNGVVGQVQEALNATKAMTSTLVVRSTAPIPVDLTATIILRPGAVPSTVQALIQTSLADHFSRLTLAAPVRQSDLVGLMESVAGVDYVILPLSHLAPQAGSKIIGEVLASIQWTRETAWDGPYHRAYVSSEKVRFTPDHALSIYLDGARANMVPSPLESNGYPLRGVTGAALLSDGRLAVSVDGGTLPARAVVSYLTGTATGGQDVKPGPLNYVTPGEWEFIFA